MGTKKRYGKLTVWDMDFVDGRYVRTPKVVRVRVMAEAEGYFMVRHPRAIPFVASAADLVLEGK